MTNDVQIQFYRNVNGMVISPCKPYQDKLSLRTEKLRSSKVDGVEAMLTPTLPMSTIAPIVRW